MTFFDWFYKTVIAQGICVLLILLSVVIIKYFFKDTFTQIEKFYIDNIKADTKISEVISSEV